jgi:two-component system chemotaxis response regulator CheB
MILQIPKVSVAITRVGRDAELNFKALEAGALDLVAKPAAEDIVNPDRARAWLRRLKLLADVPVITRHRRSDAAPPARSAASSELASLPTPAALPAPRRNLSLVAIGASTGGPPALARILGALPLPPPWPVVVVQHIVPGFTRGLAVWLSETTGLPVEIVSSSTWMEAGVVYLAPDGQHLVARSSGRLALSDAPPERGHRPSVDVLFHSIAQSDCGASCAAALLTGMGEDGARGLGAIRRAGGWTIAQDQASSVVYGMPKAAAERGAASEVLPVDHIAPRVCGLSGAQPRRLTTAMPPARRNGQRSVELAVGTGIEGGRT